MFAKLFRPKWRHASPQVRAHAVVKLRTDRPDHCTILRELALADSSADVRRAALDRIADPELLLTILVQEKDPQLQASASQRLAHWLLQQPDPQSCLPILQRLPDDSCRAQLLLSELSSSAKEQLLQQITTPAVLLQLALEAPTAALRRDCAEKLQDAAQLELLLKESRGRDKAVHRLARERLNALREAEQEQQRIEQNRQQLLDQLQQLLRSEDRQHFQLRTSLIMREWSALPAAPEAQHAAFTALYQQATDIANALNAEQARAEAERLAAEQHQQHCTRIEAALLALLGPLPQDWQQHSEQLLQQLDALEQLLTDDASSATAESRELPVSLRQVGQSAQQLHQALVRLAAHSNELDTLLGDSATSGAALKNLLNQLAWPQQFSPPPSVQQAQQRLKQMQQERQQQQALSQAQLQAQSQQLEQRLQALEQSIEQGDIRDAQQQLEQAQQQIGSTSAQEFEPRLRNLAARLKEMQDWQGFAVNGKKESLCKQMEALVESTLEPRLLADQIRTLQREWKLLDGSVNVHSQRLWQRFHAAGEAAYAPCEQYFSAQRQQREHNLQQREEICRQLEQYLEGIDWDNTDWTATELICHTAKREWKQFSPVDRSPGKALQQRFNQLIRTLDQQLRAWHQRCDEYKQQLITEAAALVDSDDCRAAADAAKRLQRQWKEAGPSFRSHERQLWKQFRGHCDSIFARLSAEQAQRQQRTQPPVIAEPLLTPAQQAAFDRCAELFDQAEGLLLDAEPESLPALLDAAGNAVRLLNQPWRERFQRRLALLQQSSEQPELLEPQLGDSERQLRELCIRLEILLNRPSPEEDQVQRMEYQMLRLQQALAEHNRAATQSDLQALVLEWETVAWNGVFPQLQLRFEQLQPSAC